MPEEMGHLQLEALLDPNHLHAGKRHRPTPLSAKRTGG